MFLGLEIITFQKWYHPVKEIKPVSLHLYTVHMVLMCLETEYEQVPRKVVVFFYIRNLLSEN